MGVTAQATFAATLVDEWARAGVRHAVLAPGSRSTPLALALDACDAVALHVHVDERSAGYLALGIGVATGVPAVVLTTSGTAAVELHPAVVESAMACVPLIACTADRPPELHDVGAPQTIDQRHLFGRSVRWYAAPGVADEAVAGTWRSFAARAVAEATAPVPGPVHLNLAFRDPLVAEPGFLPEGRPDGAPWHATASGSSSPGEREVTAAASLLDVERGVIVAGARAGGAEAVHGLAAHLGWPVLADPRSGCRTPVPSTVAAFDALLRHAPFTERERPEAVLRLGEPPASKVLAGWLAASGARQVAVDPYGRWLDPDRRADLLLAADPGELCRRLHACMPPRASSSALAWAEAEAAAQSAIDATLAEVGALSEPGVARAMSAALPEGATLVVSSSMPVRDLEWFAAPRHGVRVLANRGANGIDGMVSTAGGVALASGRTALLTGDLAFLHDTNGLLGLAGRELDLTVVVVDNRGGGIFSFLPQASTLAPERFERLFGTPQDVDLPALVAAHGLPTFQAHDPEGLTAALGAVFAMRGTSVVLVRTDRAANVTIHDRLHAAVAAALGW